jgi:hypothetical protein
MQGLEQFAVFSANHEAETIRMTREARSRRIVLETSSSWYQTPIVCLGLKAGIVVTARGMICTGNRIDTFLIYGFGVGAATALSVGAHWGLLRAEPGATLDGTYSGLSGGNFSMPVVPFIGPDLIAFRKEEGHVYLYMLGLHVGPSSEILSQQNLIVQSL